MAEQQVFATKGNLILYKKALKLAALGYELLDRKRNILIRELMSLVDKAGELRGSIEDTYKEAYSALQLANISMGLVTPYANCIPVETGVEISTRSVMGVELPKVTLKERPLKVTYGFSQTDSQLDRAYLAFEKVKQTTAVLAEVENSIYRLSVAIKKTQRRANALQNIIIPRNEHIVKFITDSLGQRGVLTNESNKGGKAKVGTEIIIVGAGALDSPLFNVVLFIVGAVTLRDGHFTP